MDMLQNNGKQSGESVASVLKKKRGYGGKVLWKRKNLNLEWKSEGVMDGEGGNLTEEVPVVGTGVLESERLVWGCGREDGSCFQRWDNGITIIDCEPSSAAGCASSAAVCASSCCSACSSSACSTVCPPSTAVAFSPAAESSPGVACSPVVVSSPVARDANRRFTLFDTAHTLSIVFTCIGALGTPQPNGAPR